VVDLGGKIVAPGLTDSNCHILRIGEREMGLKIEGTNSLDDFLAKVKERVAETEHGKWITGRGWIERFGNRPVSRHDSSSIKSRPTIRFASPELMATLQLQILPR
jgi:predicted amidohydrolase YtcJ